ncbi:hypothetical protein FA13DRAFT_1618876 [Coprinellus micaceus]|uniref:CT20-domain-containing protein n=1 Tax=Coprinellus micaceus TaxID=71717 RepID=A0A4Y7U158_COPMI|nr:hypothetical protein FA13DRAFT_1618876 [Coprinellus micaceus]
MTVSDTPASTSNGHDATASDIQFLNTVEGEISFFRSLMRARPVGVHRFFHVLAIRNAIFKDTNRVVNVDAIWEKLGRTWNLEALEVADAEHENLYTPAKNAPPIPIPSPSPTENLANHPFFRSEFHLPYDEEIETIISQRRMRSTASAPSTPGSPPPSPSPHSSSSLSSSSSPAKGKKRERPGKSQSKLAGLVGGDSDSSALTQESGDEGGLEPETPRESVVTGTATDGGTEYGEDEDTEMREPSRMSRSVSPKPTRGRGSKGSKRGARGGARGGGTTTTATRSTKKRKR